MFEQQGIARRSRGRRPSRSARSAKVAVLAESHLPLVRRVAARVAPRAWPYLEMGDLVSIGTEALLRAASEYDPDRGASFASFVYLRVRGAMLDGIGPVGQLPRGVVRRRGQRPGRVGLLAVFGLDERRLECAGDGAEELIAAIDTDRAARRLGRALASLGELDRDIIVRHYFDDDSLCDIGRAMDRSRSWASRAHTRALDRLRAALECSPQAACPVAGLAATGREIAA